MSSSCELRFAAPACHQPYLGLRWLPRHRRCQQPTLEGEGGHCPSAKLHLVSSLASGERADSKHDELLLGTDAGRIAREEGRYRKKKQKRDQKKQGKKQKKQRKKKGRRRKSKKCTSGKEHDET